MQEFLKILFDFSFKNFVFPKIVGTIYFFVVVLCCVVALFSVLISFLSGSATSFLLALGSVLYLILVLIFVRIFLEAFLLLFHISRYTGEIARRLRPKDDQLQSEQLLNKEELNTN